MEFFLGGAFPDIVPVHFTPPAGTDGIGTRLKMGIRRWKLEPTNKAIPTVTEKDRIRK